MLAKAAEQVRAIPGLDTMLADSCKVEKLLSFKSCIFGAGGGSNRLVIVYSTAWNNFDISFPFLHCLIASHADCIIYVKNQGRGMYATGNDEYGNSIDEMSSSICDLIAGMNPSRVSVLGFSGGGYAALHLAAKLSADAFLGIGVRTDLSRNSAFPRVPGRTAPCESDYNNNTLVNMKDMPEIAGIKRAVLYFGDRDESDREHALNMAGLPNFSIYGVKQGSHNLVMDFLIRGQLQEVLYNILD
jgi:pimeloyl-ACP methyl ester carboxylesterase